jgi:exosortase A-associated hydrolase 1
VADVHTEVPVTFDCGNEKLLGILHPSESGAKHGVLIVVGGPQYRVGSHRQFVLLARRLANAGIPVFRFDCRGMGDSAGEAAGFDQIDDDIRAAIDTFMVRQQGLQAVVIWGLCDAASAAMIYAHQDKRVGSVILLNPWVRSEEGQAKTILKRYYVRQLASIAFWRRLFTGEVSISKAIWSFFDNFASAVGAKSKDDRPDDNRQADFVGRMLEGLSRFSGSALFVISGDDLTAAEFEQLVQSSRSWQRLMRRDQIQTFRLDKANHTFSTREWREAVEQATMDWVAGQ